MIKFIRIFIAMVTLSFCAMTYAQNNEIELSGAKRYTTLVVETAYPFSIESYKPHSPISLLGVSHSQLTPELTIIEMLTSMRAGDWNWNSSLWSPESLKQMNARDKASRRSPSDWITLWQKNANRKYQLFNRIEYGKYVLIEYGEVQEDRSKKAYRDTIALEKIDGKWYLTQELASDPISMHWNNTAGRIQIAPNTLFNN